jgi:hypothetical protein
MSYEGEDDRKEDLMLTVIFIVVLVGAAFAAAGRGRIGQPIHRHPYNNRYNDAAAAREDHLS